MKQLFLVLAIMVTSYCSFAQTKATPKFGYKVGITTALPVDVSADASRIKTSSTMGEISYKNPKFSKKISITFNTGYLRFTSEAESKYAKIPVMVGLRYPINDIFHFGASIGPSFYNKKVYGTSEFVYSPYIGLQVKKLSADFRYLNFTKKDYVQKTIGIVFSYSLQ
jgi:hypothetical protein